MDILSKSRSSARTGYTLVELLAVIAVIGVIVALAVPTVQRARETARRTECANHLKQIGTAVHLHHDVHGAIPHNGGWDGKQTISKAGGGTFTPATTDFTTGQTYKWGVGDPALEPQQQTGCWLFAILPLVEQQNVFDSRSWQVAVPLYICPSRRSTEAHEVVDEDAYGKYEGGGWSWGKADYAGNSFLMPGLPALSGTPFGRGQSFSAISDGLSQTILVGEKAFDPSVQTPTTWYWDEPFFLGGSGGSARRGISVMRDGAGIKYKTNWGSPHLTGAQFVFGDASVQTVGYDVEWEVFFGMLTPNGGEEVPEEF